MVVHKIKFVEHLQNKNVLIKIDETRLTFEDFSLTRIWIRFRLMPEYHTDIFHQLDFISQNCSLKLVQVEGVSPEYLLSMEL